MTPVIAKQAIDAQDLPTDPIGLRIAVVTETYPPEINGVAVTIRNMLTGLVERGHQIHLIRPRQSRHEQVVDNPYFKEFLQLGFGIPGYDGLKIGLPAKRALLRLWSAQRPDIVHLVTEGPLGWSALAAAIKLDIPCSSDFHTHFDSYMQHYGVGWLNRPVAAYLRRFHNKTGSTLVPTSTLRESLLRRGYLDVREVPRGVDTSLFHPERRSPALRGRWGVGALQPVVLSVGRIAPEKNLPLVLKVFSEMKKTRPDARLVMVGDGPIKARLRARNPDVIFTGALRGVDLAAHYACADVFLFPSTTETYGNVTLEAMASGLSVIAYDYAAATHHIESGRNGLLVPFDDAREFTNIAVGLIKDLPRIQELGRQARKTVERIDWQHMHAYFEAGLLDVIATHAANRNERPTLGIWKKAEDNAPLTR